MSEVRLAFNKKSLDFQGVLSRNHCAHTSGIGFWKYSVMRKALEVAIVSFQVR